ncbi:transporter substrate-binding domain-containing protein [uncultured Alsobacter sp.]|uniref:transporter substrate-binding domain-containing protein n=1 Tax=uncultured Alsobacter sp. TaxID=1748258 RepID=UPI0025FC812A|nr:transporter substrate-binding domain-containing protein [uncultured Alsobacter sp.]
MNLRNLAMGLVALAATVLPAKAQTTTSTLDAVIQRGVINVGVGLGTPPYGLMDANMQPDGYDVSLAKLIARDLGVKVNLVDTTAANRIPNLTSGKLDIVIYSFSITAERARTIAFTNTVYVDSQVYVSASDKPATKLDDLVGKKTGVTRASTNDIVMTRKAPQGATVQRYEDDASTSQALLAGQVEGIVTSGALARAIEQRNPKLKVQFIVSQAPMGIGLRRGDADFLHWLNTEIFMLQTNGEIGELQRKWMGGEVELPRF